MLKKRIAVILLFLFLISTTGGISVLAADAGGPNDPLVSLSYARTWSQTLLASAVSDISPTLTPLYQAASKYASSSLAAAKGAQRLSLAEGGTVALSTGSCVTLLSGAAKVAIDSGNIVNVTVGAEAGNGKLNLYHLYIVCENSKATVTASSAAVFLVDGAYTSTAGNVVFKDIKTADWFYSDVYNAVKLGLIDGMSDTTFVPDGDMTVAQAIKLAACMHQKYYSGEVTLASDSGVQWYKPFVDYAVLNGVVAASYGTLSDAQYNTAITRREYVHIFYNALPASEYAAINTVSDNAIPDVGISDEFAPEIYAFYRAGILEGSEGGAFKPDTNIARREVAAILTRMFDSTARKTITLT